MAALAAERWGLPKAKKKYAGLYTDGRTGPGGPRVGVLLPQTYMNDSGKSVGPARGALGVDLDRVVVVHDEIDLPFGRVEARLGRRPGRPQRPEVAQGRARQRRTSGASASGVGRPDSTDPEIVSAHVLGRFSEPEDEVRELVERAAAMDGAGAVSVSHRVAVSDAARST